MGGLLVLIDDSAVGFWEMDPKDAWDVVLHASGMAVHCWRNAADDIETRIRELKEDSGNLDTFVITDQQLGGNRDGARLAERLIHDAVVKRAVVFSEVARLTVSQRALPIMAESGVRSRRAVERAIAFLRTGCRPKLEDLIDYGARIESILRQFEVLVAASSDLELLGGLARPAKMYGVWDGDPTRAEYLLDSWIVGLGVSVPALFSTDTRAILGDDVGQDLRLHLGPPDSEDTRRRWISVRECLHPWRSLTCSTKVHGLPSIGAFRRLWEIGRCGGNADLIPDLLGEESALPLSPREKRWLADRRRELRERVGEVMRADGPALRRLVQQSVVELGSACETIALAGEMSHGF